MNRWIENFSYLYGTERPYTATAIDKMPTTEIILKKVGCLPILFDLIKSFHENLQGTAQVDGIVSESFHIVSGVKQGCGLAPIRDILLCNIERSKAKC